MTLDALMRDVAAIEGAIAAVIVLILVISGARARVETARRTRVRQAVRGLLLAATDDRPYRRRDLSVVCTSSRSHVIAAMVDVARNVTGAARDALRDIARIRRLAEYAAWRSRMRAWWDRVEGARLLTLLGATEAETRRMLDDRHPLVRAQGAAAAADWPFPGAAAALGKLLHDESAVCRFAAKQGIMRLGPEAVDVVLAELRAADPESSDSVTLIELATSMASPEMLDLAVRYSYARDVEVRRAAAALLAAIGAEEAVERLILLLVDDAAPVRSAAAYALGAMGEWRAASALGDRLDDDDADVRFAVAVSLQRLGPPGRVVLRRVINHGPQRAATVARESLDLIARLSA